MPESNLYIRIKQALNWLKRNKGILQKDIADKMGMAEASFTRALARVKEKNDEDFIISFHSVTSEYFSLKYLLTGEGSLLANHEDDKKNVESGNNATVNIVELYSTLINQVADLRHDLLVELDSVRNERKKLIETLDLLNVQIQKLGRNIDDRPMMAAEDRNQLI